MEREISVLSGAGKGEGDEGLRSWAPSSPRPPDVPSFCSGWKEHACAAWNSLDGTGEKEVCMSNVLASDVDTCWR